MKYECADVSAKEEGDLKIGLAIMDSTTALPVSKLATVRIQTPIEVTSVWPMAGLFERPTVFTFNGQNLMELTPYRVYCTLGSA